MQGNFVTALHYREALPLTSMPPWAEGWLVQNQPDHCMSAPLDHVLVRERYRGCAISGSYSAMSSCGLRNGHGTCQRLRFLYDIVGAKREHVPLYGGGVWSDTLILSVEWWLCAEQCAGGDGRLFGRATLPRQRPRPGAGKLTIRAYRDRGYRCE